MTTELISYICLADDWLENPKVRRAGLYGRALYIAAICWSHRQNTDGDVPADVLDLLAAQAQMTPEQAQESADRLMEFGLFERRADGWHVHDYEKAQATRAERDRFREAARIRQARLRARRADVTRDERVSHTDVTSAEGRGIGREEDLSRESRAPIDPPEDPPRDPFGAPFERFWKLYPKKLAKGAAKANYVALRRRGISETDLTMAVERYAKSRRGEDPQYTLQGSTFLAKERWTDWLPGGAAEHAAERETSAQRVARLRAEREARA